MIYEVAEGKEGHNLISLGTSAIHTMVSAQLWDGTWLMNMSKHAAIVQDTVWMTSLSK